MLSRRGAEGQVRLAARAVQTRLWNMEPTVRARRQRFGFVFGFDWPTGNAFNLGLELRRDLVNVLWADQHASPVIGVLLESGLCALTNGRCDDVRVVLREK